MCRQFWHGDKLITSWIWTSDISITKNRKIIPIFQRENKHFLNCAYLLKDTKKLDFIKIWRKKKITVVLERLKIISNYFKQNTKNKMGWKMNKNPILLCRQTYKQMHIIQLPHRTNQIEFRKKRPIYWHPCIGAIQYTKRN